MAMEILTAIIPTIIDYTIRPLGRQVSYVIFCKSNLKDLRSTLKNFDAVKVRMKHAVEEVERKVHQKVETDVLNWQTEADEITREAETLLHDEGRAKTKCLIVCPNLISYHQRSRKATKLMKKIEEHENKKKEFSSVSYEAPVEDVSAIASDEYMAFESRISKVKVIITELKKPDINRIGVYGLWGVGKTTLAKEVYREAVKQKLFDDVVIILNVKEKKDNEKIQKEIAKKLRMDVDESEDMATRANLLRARIKDGKTLVILDDVLERIDFEDMGLVGVPNCNLLLTSRERKVLFNDMRMQNNFELGFLTEKESWNLFEKMAGDVKDNRILKEATQLAKKCGGLPVLVVAVASALRDSSLDEWKVALGSFERFDEKELNEKAFLALKWSYERLEEELKQLFLLCGICSNFLSDLLKYSMGLGLIKNVETVEEARTSLNGMVKKLKNSCLLQDSYDDRTVRMHELVRYVAVRIATDDQNAFSKAYGDEVKRWPTVDFLKKSTRISLRQCKIPNKFPEVPWECPELNLLILSDNSMGDSQEIPSNFFEGMKKLKVLDVSGIRIPSLPPSLLSLKHLQTLCLDRCELVDITLVGQLTNLKILSLLESKIKELPKEIGQLTRLQLLDLTGCSELVLISPGVISSLTKLEDLRMGIKSFKRWEGEGPTSGGSNATISELKHLAELTALDIHVPDANLLPANLFSDKLQRYTILIGDCWEYPNTYGTSSNMLKLKLTGRNQFDQGIRLLVKKCEQLYLDGMEIVNIISYLFNSEAVNQLKHFHVQNNDEVKYVIDSVNWSYSHNAFSCLESLALEDLVSLESVCYGQLIGESFRKLKSLRLRNLPKLIGFSSEGKQLTIATEADEIVKEDEVGGPSRLFNNGEVSMLTTLTVHGCDSLRFLFSSSMAKCLRQLKHLKISKCQALQMVYETYHLPTQLNSFECSNLSSIEIDSCDGLENVFPASVAKDLKQLSKLKVKNCGLMEVVVKEEGPQTTYEFGFPKVTFMELDNLPQLRSFYSGFHVCNWPSLNTLKFTKCGGVEIFAAEFSTYRDKSVLGHSRSTEQPFFLIEKDKSFLNLEYLVLDENTEILYGPLPAELLRKLKGIGFATSHPKSDDFFENLQNIERLRVLSAPWKELIVHDHQGSSSGEIHEVKTLPRVKSLWLCNMPELIHLGKENSQPGGPVFPNLEFLCLKKCGRLENLASALISFRNLTTLTILDCHGLQYLIPYSVAKNLQHLKKLVVKSCERMVEIVASNENDSENEITFNCLKDLQLSGLPSLQGFCKGNCIFKVPSLPTLIVEDCRLIKLKISPDGLLQSDDALIKHDCDQTDQLMIADTNLDVTIVTPSTKEESSFFGGHVKFFRVCVIACLCVVFFFLWFFLLKEEISSSGADWKAL
ncbi:disease resistance protein At4g27190-like [Pyrus x bretschneideri]|uniref:disease resistance protein At4g27190-like n=1 Tax=Pyrus x bretschneideri TaxID=225117 RepID=UPI00203084E5|nr:disease resistance protein At4g27190-like [Pyrus x bretschneideri]XP_048436566.1 disease resistance protein At4g27190-like [Pyrus x bretschneideri]